MFNYGGAGRFAISPYFYIYIEQILEMNNKIKLAEDLSKDYILSFISQEDIMEYYLGIPVIFNNLICSPLRNDFNPTCGFRYSKFGVLRFRDFSGHFWGDCFDVVAYRVNQNSQILEYYNVNHISSNTKNGFAIILDVIAKDFNLGVYSFIDLNKSKYVKPDIKKSRFRNPGMTSQAIFSFEERKWDKRDERFWSKYNIGRKLLERGRVYAINRAWINDYCIYSDRGNFDVGYAYYLGKLEGIAQFKFYFPYRTENRFYHNSSMLQGLWTLEKDGGKIGIITKSYKDVLSIKSFGIDSIAPPSETFIISPKDATIFMKKYDYTFSLMDYDKTGVKMAQILKRAYGIPPLFFTDYPFKNGNFKKGFMGAKDFSDFVAIHGVDKTKELVDNVIYELIEQYEEQQDQINWI